MDAQVLRFAVGEEAEEPEEWLLYFVTDSTATVTSTFETLFSAGVRDKVYCGDRVVRPVDLVLGLRVQWRDRNLVLRDADASTRRFYARLGCGLGAAATAMTAMTELPATTLRFAGWDPRVGDVTLEFFSEDSTSRVTTKVGQDVLSRGKYLYRLGEDPEEPSWRLLEIAFKSRRPLTILGRGTDVEVLLEEWLLLKDDRAPVEPEVSAGLRFGLLLSGVVRGRPNRDAMRPLVATVFDDLTVQIAFTDDDDLLLTRGRYKRRLEKKSSKWLLASDFLALLNDEVLTIEAPHAGTRLFAFKRCRSHDDTKGNARLLSSSDALLPYYFIDWDQKEDRFPDDILGWSPNTALAAAAHIISQSAKAEKKNARALATFALRLRIAGVDGRRGDPKALDTDAGSRIRSLLAVVPPFLRDDVDVKALEDIPDLIDTVAVVAAAAFYRTGDLLARIGLRVARGLCSPNSLRSTLKNNNDVPTALANHGLRPLLDPGTSFFSKRTSPDAFCDDLYLADFSQYPPLLQQEQQRRPQSNDDDKEKDPVGPYFSAPPRPKLAPVRAQRAFATAFGRSYRYRQLRMRLVAQASGTEAITRRDFLAAVDHVLSEGEINLRRADVADLATFLYGDDDQTLPCGALLEALLSLDGPGRIEEIANP